MEGGNDVRERVRRRGTAGSEIEEESPLSQAKTPSDPSSTETSGSLLPLRVSLLCHFHILPCA